MDQYGLFCYKFNGIGQKKLDLLDSLEKIAAANEILEDSSKDTDKNILESNYEKLNCKFEQIQQDSNDYKIIQTYLKNTHGSTHSDYTLDLLEAFSIERTGEAQKFKEELGNKMLLWHGSRLSNFVGTLSQGLRIAPPEAPATGYMFGKGVYFADMCSKSAIYCWATHDNNVACILLCEVALGQINELYNADYNASNLPQGKHSVKGIGKTYPDTSKVEVVDNMQIPLGNSIPSNDPKAYLLYNEYIVYSIDQIKIKYLLKIRFNYKRARPFSYW